MILDDLRNNEEQHILFEFAADEIERLEDENTKLYNLIKLIFESTLPYNENGECVFTDKVTDTWNAIVGGNE